MERWNQIIGNDPDRPAARRRRGWTIRRLMEWVAAAAILAAVIRGIDQLPDLEKDFLLIVAGFTAGLLLVMAAPILLLRLVAAIVDKHRSTGRQCPVRDPADRARSELVRDLGPPAARDAVTQDREYASGVV